MVTVRNRTVLLLTGDQDPTGLQTMAEVAP